MAEEGVHVFTKFVFNGTVLLMNAYYNTQTYSGYKFVSFPVFSLGCHCLDSFVGGKLVGGTLISMRTKA